MIYSRRYHRFERAALMLSVAAALLFFAAPAAAQSGGFDPEEVARRIRSGGGLAPDSAHITPDTSSTDSKRTWVGESAGNFGGEEDQIDWPDNIVMTTGERFAGVVLVLNDQQMILQTQRFGNLHIPVGLIATMQIRTPEASIDRTLYPTPAEVTSESPLAAAANLPRGGRVFSVEMGDADPGVGFAATGPLNPLANRFVVPAQMDRIGSAGGPAPNLFLSVRHGFDAVMRRVEGTMEAAQDDGSWAPVSRPGFQYTAGTRWRLAGGAAEMLVTGDTSITAKTLGNDTVELRLEAATHATEGGQPATVRINSNGGSLFIEHAEGVDVAISLPTYNIEGRVKRLGVWYTQSSGLRVVAFDGTVTANATSTSGISTPPAQVNSGERIDIDVAGAQLRIAATQAMLGDFR